MGAQIVKRKTKILLIILGLILVGGLVAANLKFERKNRVDVQTETIKRRDLVSIVSASGTIQAKRQVNVSANTMGKVTRLEVEEGDRIAKGDFLLQIDPTPLRANLASVEAALRATEARLELEVANREKAELDLKRFGDLRKQNLIPQEDLDAAQTVFSVTNAQVAAARQEVLRQQATMENARYNLNQVTLNAELSGVVTRLNIEEGENVVTGTMNNPGTVLLTIADLSEIEAEIEVDETDVVDVRLGQEAEVTIDAYPDEIFSGVVTRVGNSAITNSSASGPQAVNFRVTVFVKDEIPNVRPGLSCTADITVATRDDTLAIPIQSLTIRQPPSPEPAADPDGSGIQAASPEEPGADAPGDAKEEDDEDTDEEEEEVEGIFLIVDEVARFHPVEIGISGEKHFELLTEIEEGAVVVVGPYKAIRELQHDDAVKVKKKSDKEENGD